MPLSTRLYLALILCVAIGRLIELRHSSRNQRRLSARGATRRPEPGYRWMVLLHTSTLIGCAVETSLSERSFIPWLGWTALLVFVASSAGRWWVIVTLREHWNTQVMDSARLGVVTSGPYAFVRHPNYAAVFLEMLALPLIHTAWITALLATPAHLAILRQRIRLEEGVLMANHSYRSLMGGKPRFIPGVW
jgi:methyltransferase